MIFITTKEQQDNLHLKYKLKIKEIQKKIDERVSKTGKIEKYTAYAYVKKPAIVFYYENEESFVEVNGIKEKCFYNLTDEYESFHNHGRIYKTDSDFNVKINNFLSIHKSWKIIFYPNKSDGGVCYCSDNIFDVPAELKSLDDTESLLLEDSNKYELCCG